MGGITLFGLPRRGKRKVHLLKLKGGEKTKRNKF